MKDYVYKKIEVVCEENSPCPCGKGNIKYIFLEDENYYELADVSLRCEECAKHYYIAHIKSDKLYEAGTHYLVPIKEVLTEENQEEILRKSIKIPKPIV